MPFKCDLKAFYCFGGKLFKKDLKTQINAKNKGQEANSSLKTRANPPEARFKRNASFLRNCWKSLNNSEKMMIQKARNSPALLIAG